MRLAPSNRKNEKAGRADVTVARNVSPLQSDLVGLIEVGRLPKDDNDLDNLFWRKMDQVITYLGYLSRDDVEATIKQKDTKSSQPAVTKPPVQKPK